MAKYQITTPDGQTYEVNAPDSATKEQVMAYVQQNHQSDQPQSTALGNAMAPIQGVNRIAPQMLGAGSDLGSMVNNFLAKVGGEYSNEMNAITGTNKTPLFNPVDPSKQLGGSAWQTQQIENALGSSPFQVQNPNSNLQQDLALGGNIMGYGLMNPAKNMMGMLGNMAKMAPSAAGAITGKEVFPNNPYAESIGILAGGLVPATATAAAKGIGKVASNVIGGTTGAGAEAIKQAYQAGKDSSKVFLDNLRNKAPLENVLSSAKEALYNIRTAASTAYRSGMADISKDASVLDFSPIDKAMANARQMGSYKGRVLNPDVQDTIQQLDNKISEWKQLNPAEYHTPEGIDALKQAIGDIRDGTQLHTRSNAAATQVYKAIKNQIIKQSPSYADIMRNYSEAQDSMKQIERALSLNDKASADTGLRKLQSLMRNNVNTNYSNRLNLASQLENQGGVELKPALAGQALNSVMPRGLMGAVGAGGGTLAAITHPESWPGLLAAAPFFSPRLMGEAAYGMGKFSTMLPSASSIGPGINLSALTNFLGREQAQSKRK